MNQTGYFAGWSEVKTKRVLKCYEEQTDEEAVAEDEDSVESIEPDQEVSQ